MGATPTRDTAAWSAMAGMILTTLCLCEKAEGDPFGAAIFIKILAITACILALAEVTSDVVLLAGINLLMKTFKDFINNYGFFLAPAEAPKVLSDISDMGFSKETAATSLRL